jgi:hypothetical protein
MHALNTTVSNFQSSSVVTFIKCNIRYNAHPPQKLNFGLNDPKLSLTCLTLLEDAWTSCYVRQRLMSYFVTSRETKPPGTKIIGILLLVCRN